MKKKDYLKDLRIDKLGENTIFIQNRYFNFSYTVAKSIVKDEYVDKCRYFGGLQSEFMEGSSDYNALENWLCDIAEIILNY